MGEYGQFFLKITAMITAPAQLESPFPSANKSSLEMLLGNGGGGALHFDDTIFVAAVHALVDPMNYNIYSD